MTIFSALNNLTNLTDLYETEIGPSICGLTKNEITNYFYPQLEKFASKEKTTVENFLEKLNFWYNGYQLSSFSNTRYYNIWSVLNALKY